MISAARKKTSAIFGYEVSNPREYGVIEFSKEMYFKKVTEKPTRPLSNIIATGLYFFSSNLGNYTDKIKASHRSEYEITDLLNLLASEELLEVKKLNRGTTWLDMGTIDDLLMASNFVKNVQSTQGFIVGSPEEASWRMKNISDDAFKTLCQSSSCKYLEKLQMDIRENY